MDGSSEASTQPVLSTDTTVPSCTSATPTTQRDDSTLGGSASLSDGESEEQQQGTLESPHAKVEMTPGDKVEEVSSIPSKSVELTREEAISKAKEDGNQFLQKGLFEDAIASYSYGLTLDPNNHILYSNRSAAYFKLRDYARAHSDAERCLELEPQFLKAYSRSAAALLGLGRPDDAVRRAQEGLAHLKQRRGQFEHHQQHGMQPSTASDEQSWTILEDLRRRAQTTLLMQQLDGSWRGTVHEKLGSYEQVFHFSSETQQVIVDVLGRQVVARYVLRLDMHPFGLDISPEIPPEEGEPPLLPPPTIPNIFRLVCLFAQHDVNANVSASPPSRQEFTGLEPLPTTVTPDMWELEFCSPYMQTTRPTLFDGPGYSILKKFDPILDTPRSRISPDIERMSFDEQLRHYFEELLTIKSTLPAWTDLEPDDDQATAMVKAAEYMRLQAQVLTASRKFPDTVSAVAEELVRPLSFHKDLPDDGFKVLKQRRAAHEQGLSQACLVLLEHVRDHVKTTGLASLAFSAATPDHSDVPRNMAKKSKRRSPSSAATREQYDAAVSEEPSRDTSVKRQHVATPNSTFPSAPSPRWHQRWISWVQHHKLLTSAITSAALLVAGLVLTRQLRRRRS